MKIYTRSGDGGQTFLYGGTRISKASLRLHAYGTVDELNTILALALSTKNVPKKTAKQLHDIQIDLFTIGADLATPIGSKATITRIHAQKIDLLEQWIDSMEAVLPSLESFIVPSGMQTGAFLHNARTVCRRAERWIVQLRKEEQINERVLQYMNRLSDYLFVTARYVNAKNGAEEETIPIQRSQNRKHKERLSIKKQTEKQN